MKENVAIQVENLSKEYRLGVGPRHRELRDLLAYSFQSLTAWRQWFRPSRKTFWALKNATFDIHHGESVGVIGLNGAGKSTLLKILSRITDPSTGTAQICGRLGALLEVGTGFHPELTGRENIYLYGTILGMNKAEIDRKFNAIVQFAGIPDFIETPVKRYSSGMYVRLAFAVAAHVEPDILLLDEVLAVGDLPFQRKCIEFAKRLQQSNATILLVSHNMFNIKNMCDRVIYLRKGNIEFDGPTDEGIRLYEEDCRLSVLTWTENKPEEWPIIITDFSLFDENNHAKNVFEHGEQVRLRFNYQTRYPVESPNFIVSFVRSDGVACCNYSTEADGFIIEKANGIGTVELTTPPLKLVAELYTIHILIREQGFQKILCAQIGSTFHIRHSLFDTHFGVFHEPAQWSWQQ